MRLPRRTTVVAGAILSGALSTPAADPLHEDGGRHALLLSVDGLHQADLNTC
jgi:hypothetical protein